jgi:hypothetical protein
MDFGEHLVVIRERLEVPLPNRVPFWRLHMAVGIESSCASFIYLFYPNWRSCVQDAYGLTSPDQDFDDVIEQFRQLNNRLATHQQIEQAEEAFKKQMLRRFDRYTHELRLWNLAVHRGMFLGTLLMSLILISVIMCMLTDRIFAIEVIMVSLLIFQLFGVFICLQGWHRL